MAYRRSHGWVTRSYYVAAPERQRRLVHSPCAVGSLALRSALSVDAAQLDDCYWWNSHTNTSVVDVLLTNNGQMPRQ
jgi:hypothetical protein